MFSRCANVADIGSGAGLPGIVIALARPDLKITLIEPLARRCEFLFEVIDEFALEIEVIRGKSEALKGRYDYLTARAVAPLDRLIETSWHLLSPKAPFLR